MNKISHGLQETQNATYTATLITAESKTLPTPVIAKEQRDCGNLSLGSLSTITAFTWLGFEIAAVALLLRNDRAGSNLRLGGGWRMGLSDL